MLLNWIVVFLLIALIAGYFGFGGVSQQSAWIAKTLFFIFLILFILAWMQDSGFINTDFRLFSTR